MNISPVLLDDDPDMFDYNTFSHGLYIGGQWRPSSDGRHIKVVDPSTEAVIAAVPDATLADAQAAVEAAAKAAAGW
ncbi:aldehyde dehydrogenase family protein, partial [Mesorhizobium sp. M3A.F.Ca.ET.201.01.1.1]